MFLLNFITALILAGPWAEGRGGFATGNGGLAVACLEERFHPHEGRQRIWSSARFFDLARWNRPSLVFESETKAVVYGLNRIIRIKPEIAHTLHEEEKHLGEAIDRHLKKYDEGWSYENIARTGDYPDRDRPFYSCTNGSPAQVFQLARYEPNGSFYLLTSLYRALSPTDRGAFRVHEVLYQWLSKMDYQPPSAEPVTLLISALFSPTSSDSELKTLLENMIPMIPNKNDEDSTFE